MSEIVGVVDVIAFVGIKDALAMIGAVPAHSGFEDAGVVVG